MGDQLLARTRVAWLQSQAFCRVQQKRWYLRTIHLWTDFPEADV